MKYNGFQQLSICFYILISVATEISGFSLSNDSFIYVIRDTRVTNKCNGFNVFKCRSGQCISIDNKCNGVADCTDKSDETRETCLNMFCPLFSFKCDYGACVHKKNAECDGMKDCIDNSDERYCITSDPTPKLIDKPPIIMVPPTSQGCILPDHPENGKWTIISGVLAEPKTKVPDYTLITYSCSSGYKLSSNNVLSVCLEKGWSAETPTCSKLCPPLYRTEVLRTFCYNENGCRIKCTEATDGAYANFLCSPYYELADRADIVGGRVCRNGTWNLPAPQCIPACGKKRDSVVPLIVNDKNVIRGHYPWVTALYQRQGGEFINLCSGSMLTQRVIITAASCVSNDDEAVDKDILRIGVGKYYNKFMDSRDTEAQYSTISEIVVHPKYKGEAQNYASDIAILVTTDTLLLSKVVQPVCYHNLNNIPLNNGMHGVITGWGYATAGGNPSDELKEISIPYKEDGTCEAEFPASWTAKYFTYDKMCVSHYNRSIAVYKGNGGGGLVFPYKDGRYYIHGILSVSYQLRDEYDIQPSALFTKVSSHYEWVELVTAKYS